eukprot:365611-Chlamydomonas_euryale.AAC.3
MNQLEPGRPRQNAADSNPNIALLVWHTKQTCDSPTCGRLIASSFATPEELAAHIAVRATAMASGTSNRAKPALSAPGYSPSVHAYTPTFVDIISTGGIQFRI